jgi:hypothetical protein
MRDRPPRLGCPAWSFQCRAALYARLDTHLRQKTRFFGAAFMTNRVLGYLVSARSGLSISEATCDWLARLGGALETANLDIARALDDLSLEGPSLDGAIVSREQSIVADALDTARIAQPGFHSRMLSELDILLNQRHWTALLRLNSDVYWYCRILSAVREQLACPIEFGSRRHRETIGMALIANLRREDNSRRPRGVRQLKQHIRMAGLA